MQMSNRASWAINQVPVGESAESNQGKWQGVPIKVFYFPLNTTRLGARDFDEGKSKERHCNGSKETKGNETENRLMSREQIASRWGVSTETVKRRERDDTLKGLHFNKRLVRYRLQDVRSAESQARTDAGLEQRA